MFKLPINKRKKDVGKIKYLGWSKEIYSYDINKLISATNFYFLVEGKKYFDKKRKKYLRPKYLQILQIPYIKDYPKRFKYLYNEHTVKIYSSDPSFKYYLAYALNKANAVIVNNYTKKELGIALTHFPKMRNPKLHQEMNKHFYRLIEFISIKKVESYMQDRFYLGINKLPQIKG
jgi:hypothetical protein